MRIEYETTLDDFADVHLRAHARSSTAKRERWQVTFCIATLTGFGIYFFLALCGASLTERLL